jgi:A/G-specific adenine glycosylase
MELGEVICTPQSPKCHECPVARHCRANAEGLTDEIPAPRRKRASVHVKIAAAILRDLRGRTLLVQDPGAHDTVLFSRMWQFPAVEVTRHAKAELEAHLRTSLGITKFSLEELPAARHGVTFRNITLLPFLASVSELPKLPRTRILSLNNLSKLPISSATRKIAAAAADPMTR